MISYIRFLLIVSTFWLPLFSTVYSQDWSWDWANSYSRYGNDAWMDIQDVGPSNYSYSVMSYDTLLLLPDTAFHHPEHWGGSNCNTAFVINDDRGSFSAAIDLYSPPGHTLHNSMIKTDASSNIFISSNFSNKAFILDTFILMCNTPYTNSPDAMLVKLNQNLEMEWATTIGGTLQDDLRDFEISDEGDIYILSEQIGASAWPTTVNFFGQDTVYSEHDFTSVTKLDNNGNMIWRHDLHGEISCYQLVEGEDNKIYLWGKSWTDIVVGQDTIFKPNNPEFTKEAFILILEKDGSIHQFEFYSFPVYPTEMIVNNTGDYYISASLWDTIILNQDTIIVPEDSYYGFMGKFDSEFTPLWYHSIPIDNGQQLGIFRLALDENNLVFMSSSNDDVLIDDTLLVINYGFEGFYGELNNDGALINLIKTETNYEFRPYQLQLDNCKNIISSGLYRGIATLGDIKLDSYSNNIFDAFIGRIDRKAEAPFSLGPDTVVCNSVILNGPEGYSYYQWNGQQNNEDVFEATATGWYDLKYGGEEGCWGYDTLFVVVLHADSFDLGPDTAILLTDTITLEVAGQYSTYEWSDGSTNKQLILTGTELGLGTHEIWVRAQDQVCVVFDTIYIEVKSEFGIKEQQNNKLKAHPNPFSDQFTIALKPDFKHIEIYNTEGISIYSKEINIIGNQNMTIRLPRQNKGIYFLKVTSVNSSHLKKIIKR